MMNPVIDIDRIISYLKLVKRQVLVYFLNMKFLILFLVLAISAQPLQAGFCDMDMGKNQETPHHMDMSDSEGHDCCDTGEDDSQEGCDSGMNCGMCFVSVSALPGIVKINASWGLPIYHQISSSVTLPSHSSPLYRPPIS